MKLACIIVAACLAVAYGEYCNRDDDCGTYTQCRTNFRLNCFRDHVCSCIPSNDAYKCTTQSSCDESVIGTCRYNDHKWHCVDGTCHCRYISG